MAEASATFAYLKGLKSSLMCTMVVFLIGIPKNGFGFEGLGGFWFWGLVGSRWAARRGRGNALWSEGVQKSKKN
jgi:hypothetical protein